MWAVCVALHFCAVGGLSQASFSNGTAITFAAGGAIPAPYPSVITVSNVTAAITSVSVTLRNVSHVVPDDFDILLVGPNGGTVLLMSDAGGAHPISNALLTFSATAPVPIPDSAQIVSGTYLPANYGADADLFPTPAPAGPYGNTLTAYNGISPNGPWRLYVYDDAPGTLGGISGGWSITLGLSGPLVIVEHPQSQEAVVGDDVIFRVTAYGSTPIGYQWHFNGAPMAGETNSTLTLSNVQATSGGRFHAKVFNDAETLLSDSAVLTVPIRTALNGTDDFRSRPVSSARVGWVQGDSRTATSEPGEPIPFGGGKSVWFEWLAPNTGIATFTTRGSAFDTWLTVFTGGIFTGTGISNLTLVTQDDDRGGFYSSTAQFNASEGARYQIALDGFGVNGSGGEYTVSWSMELTADRVPVIISNPQPHLVVGNGSPTFRVVADSVMSYQWLLNGAPIPGATSSTLQLHSPDFDDIGIYSVQLRSASGRTIISAEAPLEIGSHHGLTIPDARKHLISGRPVAGFFKDLALNAPVWRQAATPGDNKACAAFFGLPEGLHPLQNGAILVETTGSPVPARLAIYEGYHEDGEIPKACGPPGNPSVAILTNAVQGMDYTIEVIGFPNAGNIKLTNTLGIAPPLPDVMKHCLVPAGGSMLLTMPAGSWVPTPRCQWYFGSQPVQGSNQTTLLINNFDILKQGYYSVVMSNFVRKATSSVAYLQLNGPLAMEYARVTNNTGNIGIRVAASNAAPFVLQGTPDLGGQWSGIVTNQDPCKMVVVTNAGAQQQFFRAAPPQP